MSKKIELPLKLFEIDVVSLKLKLKLKHDVVQWLHDHRMFNWCIKSYKSRISLVLDDSYDYILFTLTWL